MARYAKFFSLGGGGGGTNNLQLPVGTILDTTLRQVQDGLGTGSPLYISTRRVGITSDSSVTTQTSSVIQASTTNANLVIAPNGTGALIASIPDGTFIGGNARGQNAVDLQMERNAAENVASGNNATIGGGNSNKASGTTVPTVAGGQYNFATGLTASTIGGGSDNLASSSYSTISGGRSNIASSTYATVSGGQSNTASTNTHATVVGGSGNTSSGLYSISGGQNSVASGSRSVAFGESSQATGANSICLGGTASTAQGGYSTALSGTGNNALSNYSLAQGYVTQTNLLGQIAFSGTAFAFPSERGFCQQSLLTANRAATLNSAATTVLSLDGTGTTNLIIPNGNNRLWAVKVVATAFVSVAGGTLVLGDSYMGEFTLLFKKVGGTSSVVGVNSANLIYDTNMATAAFTFAAGASQDLQITFKAPTTASATTFRCVAKVELVEVAY